MNRQGIINSFRDSIPSWRSKSMRYRYPALASRFMSHVGAKPTYVKSDAVQFLNHLVQNGASAGYVRWAANVLIAFYKHMGHERPFSARELPPPPREHEMVKPTLSQDSTKLLIVAAKTFGTARMKAYLALSTTYGLRATELAAIKESDISDNTITIRTAKGGILGRHPIPAEIAKYLQYKFKPADPQSMGYLFKSIQRVAGETHKEREGFHSIRRSLVKGLLDAGVEPRYVHFFMRWSTGRAGILGVYAAPGPDEYEKAHEKIFKLHPYLYVWK